MPKSNKPNSAVLLDLLKLWFYKKLLQDFSAIVFSISQPIFGSFHQEEHDWNHYQSQDGGVSQSKDDSPCQRRPENYVLSTHIEV